MLQLINPFQITKLVGPKEYLDLMKNKKHLVLKIEIVSPKLGKPGLGGFKVTFRAGYLNLKK